MNKGIVTVVLLCAFAFVAWCVESLIGGDKFDRVEIIIITVLAISVIFLVGVLTLHFGRF